MASDSTSSIDPAVAQSEFVSQTAKKQLRVTCYGSSSSLTPEPYLTAARSLGYILAKRGHTCINGAGSFGCMAAMNDGAATGNGHIVGVIHEMWVVDGADWSVRDGGAHKVFTKPASDGKRDGPVREMLIAGGDDLQERKKLLVQNADALVVLPGGPGTWDELWEMACARNIGLSTLPIVVVNVDGYYEPFAQMLQKAYDDSLIKLKPEQIVHFVATPQEAVQWAELQSEATPDIPQQPKLQKRTSTLKRSSFMSMDYFRRIGSANTSNSSSFDENGFMNEGSWSLPVWSLSFAAGVALGVGMMLARPK
uniref:Cytokinin riboside 5'-monophosphate phosphoribohydrolase n=1 Tax=Grammatophora oceanica TaxID=210454 RepID=A0A7S1UNC4_9STRA